MRMGHDNGDSGRQDEALGEAPQARGGRGARPTTFRTLLLLLLLLTSAVALWHFRYRRVVPPPAPSDPFNPRQEMVLHQGQQIRVMYDQPYDSQPAIPPDQLAMDLFIPEAAKDCPVLIYLHGGGWIGGNKNGIGPKSLYFASRGILVASVNYRLCVPRPTQNGAIDIATAIRFLHQNAANFGGDPNRLFILGHSAGAHLGALTVADPSLLGDTPAAKAVRGVILLDGSAYDVPALMASKAAEDFVQFFGTNPTDWQGVSPYHLATGRTGLPPMLLVHAGDEPVRKMSAQRLAAALETGGSKAYLIDIPFRDHYGVDSSIGEKYDPLTPVIERFMQNNGRLELPAGDAP